MLEGIKVLNKVAETESPNWSVLVMIGIAMIITLVGIITKMIRKNEVTLIDIFGWGLIIGMIAMLIIDYSVEVPTGEYTYQVTIEESVNFKEFNDKYMVTEQEGEIYYIKER